MPRYASLQPSFATKDNEMTGLITTGAMMTAGIGVGIAVLTRVLGGTRISRRAGILIVILSCLLWHALAWASLDCTIGVIHQVLTYSIVVPFGFGFGQGIMAFVIALVVQAALAATVAVGMYWLLRRDWREKSDGR